MTEKDLELLGEFVHQADDVEAVFSLGKISSSLGQPLTTDSRVPGRLLGKDEQYKLMKAEEHVLQTLRWGYKLQFESEPPASFVRNNKSALADPGFVRGELHRLESLGCTERVKDRPYITLPLSLVFSNKPRLVVDASRGLNPYCVKNPTRLEDLSQVGKVIQKGDWMVTNDFDSGYWHVPIHPQHWKYLGVHYEDEEGNITYWVWKVLCLGLRDACNLFTRLTRPVMADLRKRGMRGLIYIDDSWVVGRTFQDCLEWETELKKAFEGAGWVFKASKRSGDPSQRCTFLGLEINSEDLSFNIPEHKLQKIVQACKTLGRSKGWVAVRRVASVVGLLQSVRLAVGPLVAILTRSLYHVVNEAKSWKSFVKLDDLARLELDWWINNLSSVSSFPIQGKKRTVKGHSQVEVAGDGSGVGHFVYLVGNGERLASRPFSEREMGESSTYRELCAFEDMWTSEKVLEKYKGYCVTHFTDSQAMCSIVEKGSRNRKLQPIILRCVLKLREYNITVDAVWRSRDEGIIRFADMGSRDFHYDDIAVDCKTFDEIQKRFGPFQVDGFASHFNKKAPRFFSKQDSPGSEGVDFFLQDLSPEDNHWLFPMPKDLCKVVWRLQEQEAKGAILVPVWPASPFFNFFWPDGSHAASWVEGMWITRPQFICGPLVTSKGFKGRRIFESAVLKVDFANFLEENFFTPSVRKELCLVGGCNKCT